MANYVKLSNGIYVGITTDTKPTNNTVPNGTILYEFATDYSKYTQYVNDGSAWNSQLGFAQTLTNKTLTSPIISTISNTGTLTLPTSTDTLVGRATTDTLTNKTLTSPTINTATITGATLDSTTIGVDLTPDIKRHGEFWALATTVPATGSWQGFMTNIAVSGAAFSAVQTDSTGTRGRWT